MEEMVPRWIPGTLKLFPRSSYKVLSVLLAPVMHSVTSVRYSSNDKNKCRMLAYELKSPHECANFIYDYVTTRVTNISKRVLQQI